MSYSFRSFRSFPSFFMLALLVSGCSMDPGALDQGAHAQSGNLDNVPDDEDLQFVKQHGFGGFTLVNDCVSVGDDGSVVQGDPLPVGGGRHLECTTAQGVTRTTAGAATTNNEPWCVLGQLSSHKLEGDSRLSIKVTNASENGPWSLVATAAEPIEIHSVSFMGAFTWPLSVNASYDTVDMQPMVEGKNCDQLFGL